MTAFADFQRTCRSLAPRYCRGAWVRSRRCCLSLPRVLRRSPSSTSPAWLRLPSTDTAGGLLWGTGTKSLSYSSWAGFISTKAIRAISSPVPFASRPHSAFGDSSLPTPRAASTQRLVPVRLWRSADTSSSSAARNGASIPAGRAIASPYSLQLLACVPELPVGVYAALTGPCYETPAEIRALAACGADAVGMSTALEAETAAELGLEVVAISCITNKAAGLGSGTLDHAEVLANANLAVERLAEIIERPDQLLMPRNPSFRAPELLLRSI